MRLPQGFFPYSAGYAAHPAAQLAAHHAAAAAAAWNNLKQNGGQMAAAAAAAAAGFQPLPRYWLHPQWPAHSAVFDPVAMAAGQLQHPEEAGSSPPQHPDYSLAFMQSQQRQSPASSPASSLAVTPEPENNKSPSRVDKAVLDLRMKISTENSSPIVAKQQISK